MGVFVCVCVIFGCNFFDLVSVVSLTTLTSLTFLFVKNWHIDNYIFSFSCVGVGWLDFLVSALLSIWSRDGGMLFSRFAFKKCIIARFSKYSFMTFVCFFLFLLMWWGGCHYFSGGTKFVTPEPVASISLSGSLLVLQKFRGISRVVRVASSCKMYNLFSRKRYLLV